MKKAKKLILAIALALASLAAQAQTQQQRLEKHVYYMASDTLQGRKAGSTDARKVADYVEREFRQIGLQPLYGSHRLYFRTLLMSGVEVLTEKAIDTLKYSSTIYRDVVGVIPGCDPVLKNEYIVVGGHYDHLGVRNGKVYNGADDNASGTACVIEMARQLVDQRPARTIIICAFDAEEIGLFGSKALAVKMEQMHDISKVKMMMSIDMVGWLKQGKDLRFEGTGTLKGCEKMLQDEAAQVGISIRSKRFESSPLTATDTEPFAKAGIPTLAVTTGLKSPYHKPEDDANLIDYPGLDKIVNYMTSVVMRMASTQEQMATTGRVAQKHRSTPNPFEVGVMAGYTMTHVLFPNAAIDGKSKIGFAGGISTNWNFSKRLGLQTDLLVELPRTPYPHAGDVFGEADIYRQTGLLLPMQLRASFIEGMINFGLGGYYGYAMNRRLTAPDGTTATFDNAHQFGVVWSIEERVANLSLDFTFYHQLNDMLPTRNAIPAVKRNAFTFTLGWYF